MVRTQFYGITYENNSPLLFIAWSVGTSELKDYYAQVSTSDKKDRISFEINNRPRILGESWVLAGGWGIL